MPLDCGGQLYGQLIQVCDIHKGITIDSLDVLFVASNRGSNEQDPLAAVFLFDAAQIFFGSTSVITSCSWLSVGYEQQDLYLLRTSIQPFRNIAERRTVAVITACCDVHHAVFVIAVNGFKLSV